MSEVKEKFSNLIKDQNLNIFGDPFVIEGFLKNIEDYLNWNTLNEAINSDIVNWSLIGDQVPYTVPFWSGIRQQNKQFILDHVNNGSTFYIERCCLLNDNLKSLVSDIQEVFAVACDIQILGSKSTNSKSFDPHADRMNLFIIQAIGDTDWIIFKNKICDILPCHLPVPFAKREELTPVLEVTLSPGDLLYIPPRTFHIALPKIPRLSMSIPCISLDNFYEFQKYLPDIDQIVNQLRVDVNKYEF